MEKELLIRATGIVKKYGSLTAVDNVSMDVHSGEIYGVAGLNGAGKSTLLAILAGVMRPDSGDIVYKEVRSGSRVNHPQSAGPGAGGAYKSTPAKALRIGYVPQDIALFPDLSVYDNLKFWAIAGPVRWDSIPLKDRILSAATVAGLTEKLRQSVRSLSGGMKQRVNIAAALAAGPDILIMDEPTAGLDVKNRRDVLNFINSLARSSQYGLAVVCTSHQSGELEMISDRLLLLDRGRTVFDGSPVDVFSGKYTDYANIDDILYSLGNA